MSAARNTQGDNQPSAVLSQDANNKIFSLLGSRAQALSTAVVAVTANETPKSTEWREVVTGVVTLTKDYIRRAFYIQVYDLVGWQRVEEVEVARGTPYHCSEPLFHQLPAQERIMGLKFASEVDARAFTAAVRAVVAASPQKPEGRPPPSPKELAAPSQHLQQQQQQKAPETEHQESHGAKTNRQQQQQQPQHSQLLQQQGPQQQQQQPQSPREPPMPFPIPLQPGDKTTTTLDRRRASKKITKDMIGYPTNFQHIYHVGFNPEAAPQHLRSEEREQQATFKAAADSPRRPAPPPPPARHGAPRTAVEASVATPDTPETVASAQPLVSAGALGSPGVLQSSKTPIDNQGDILEDPPDSVDTSSLADITSPLRETESPFPPHTSSQELSLVSSDPVEGEFSVLITTKEPTASSESTENNTDTNHADQDSSTASLELNLNDSPETSEIQCVSVDSTGPESSTGSEKSNSFIDLQKRNIPADPKEPSHSSYTTPEHSNTPIIPVPLGTSLSNLPAATYLSPPVSASTSPQTQSTPSTTSTQSAISSSTRASVESSSTVSSPAERRPHSSATTTSAEPSPSPTITTVQPASSNTTANSGSGPITTTTTPGSVSSTTVATPELVPFAIGTTPAPASATAITLPERVSSTTTALPEPASFTMIPGPVLSTTTTTTGPAPLPTTTTISELAPAIISTPGPVSFANPTTEPNNFVASSMSSHSFPTSPPTPPAAALPSAAVPDTSPSVSGSTTATDPRAPQDTVCGMSPPTPPPPRQRKRPISRQSPSSAPPPPPPPMSALTSPPPPLP